MKCDLHFHSNFSDSSLSVEEALALADREGLDYISFTDHDTTETYAYAKKIAGSYRVRIIPGIEISAYDFERNRHVHLLAYNYKKRANIDRVCQGVLDRRKKNSLAQLALIEEAGYKISYDKLHHSANSNQTLYKQQIMYALVGKPYYTEEYQSLYKKLFKNGGIAQRDIEYLDVFVALKAVLLDGGIPVLAHPGQFDSMDLIPDLIGAGLRGLEVYHPDNSPSLREKLLEIARENDLLITGGSDNHGIFWTKHEIGIGNLEPSHIEELLT